MKTHPCWRLSSCDLIDSFLPAVIATISEPLTLCIEHTEPVSAAVELFERYPAAIEYWPHRDAIRPHSQLHFCSLTSEFVGELSFLEDRHELRELLHHVRGYDATHLIFHSHDADWGGDILLSSLLDIGIVTEICELSHCRAHEDESRFNWEAIQAKPRRTNGTTRSDTSP